MLLALGFVLELPWSLGVPSDAVVPIWTHDGPDVRVMPRLLGDPPSDTACLAGWLRFRTVRVAVQRPLAASDLAFGDLDVEASSAPRRQRRMRGLSARLTMLRAHREERTVAISYAPVTTLDTGPEEISGTFAAALSNLNSWLVSLGVLRDDRLRPLSHADLPAVLPVLPVTADEDRVLHGSSRGLVLRPHAESVRIYGSDEMEQARRMLRTVTTGAPLASFYEIVQRAGSARRASRDREAVVDYATAGELFITALIGVVGERAGLPQRTLSNVLDGAFRDRCLHLSRLLGAPDDPSGEESPMFLWWLHCYIQRNRIVHEGADSTPALSEFARIGLVELVVNIRELLRVTPEFVDIARTIHWGFRMDETGTGDSSFPDLLS